MISGENHLFQSMNMAVKNVNTHCPGIILYTSYKTIFSEHLVMHIFKPEKNFSY